MLILDEPTNHLDVDAREALVQALNSYSGAVVLVSHDRHMLELTADRLVLVADGTAREFAGSLEDYTDLILGKNQPKSESAPKGTKKDRKAAAAEREQAQALRKEVRELEAVIVKLTADRSAIDLAMFDPRKAEPLLSKLTMGDLMKRRADVETALEEAEGRWMEASEKLERQQAA
jgi:ATP-binding cassette subfamily F protein 3